MLRMRLVVISLFIALIVLVSAMAALAVRLKQAAPRMGHVLDRAATQSHGDSVVPATVLTVHGRTLRVNHARRSVTLELASNSRMTVWIKNRRELAKLKAGAWVTIRYYELVTVRAKKSDETLPSVSLRQGISMSSGDKGSVAGRKGKTGVAVSVIDIDRAHATLSVRSADQTIERVRTKNPRALIDLQIGDKLVVDGARAIAISAAEEPDPASNAPRFAPRPSSNDSTALLTSESATRTTLSGAQRGPRDTSR